LDLDYGLRLRQLPLKLLVLPLELFYPPRKRIHGLRLASTVAATKGLEGSRVALTAPGRHQGEVEPLAPQDGSDLSRLAAGVQLRQNPQLVLGRVPPTPRLLRDLRIRSRQRRMPARAVGAGGPSCAARKILGQFFTPAFLRCHRAATSSPATVISEGLVVSLILAQRAGQGSLYPSKSFALCPVPALGTAVSQVEVAV